MTTARRPMAATNNDDEGGQSPWIDVWPDCSPEDEAVQSGIRQISGQV